MGSLVAALLLTKDLDEGGTRQRIHFVAMGVLLISLSLLLVLGFDWGGMKAFIALLFGGILLAGLVGRSTVYRTLFYAPHFTAGVATFLLWKKMYNPQTGPINTALDPLVGAIESLFQWLPPVAGSGLATVGIVIGVAVMGLFHRMLGRAWGDAEVGKGAIVALTLVCLLYTSPSPRDRG